MRVLLSLSPERPYFRRPRQKAFHVYIIALRECGLSISLPQAVPLLLATPHPGRLALAWAGVWWILPSAAQPGADHGTVGGRRISGDGFSGPHWFRPVGGDYQPNH